jgi:hypothetical protein
MLAQRLGMPKVKQIRTDPRQAINLDRLAFSVLRIVPGKINLS